MKKIIFTMLIVLFLAVPAFGKTVTLGCSQNGTKFTTEIPDGCTVYVDSKNMIQTGPNTWTSAYRVMCNGKETGLVNKDTHLYEPYKETVQTIIDEEPVEPTAVTSVQVTTTAVGEKDTKKESKSFFDVVINFFKKLFGG